MTTPDEPDDFIVTPEDELLFRLAHNWHQKHNHIYDNAFYDPALNYVYLRDSFGPVEMLTTYTHESAHALISRTSYGMMLIQLFLVSVRIHGYIRYACLEPLFHALTPRMQWPYASVYEALVDIPMTDRPEPPSLRLAYLFSEMLHESKDLVDACTLLRDVEHRRGRLLEVWAQCQEGFATFSQIMWSGEESGLYQKLSEEWFPEMESEERDDLRDAVGVYNARMLRKVLDGRGLPPQYISGCRAFLSLSESVQSVSDDYIWNARMAGLLAGYFPFHVCDILGCSSQEFDELLGTQALNPDIRLQVLVDRPDILRSALMEKEGIPGALQQLAGAWSDPPLFAGAVNFGVWLDRCVANPDAVVRLVGSVNYEVEGMNQPGDHRWRMLFQPDDGIPPLLLLSSGKIITGRPLSRIGFVKNYGQKWAIGVTLFWFEWLSGLAAQVREH